jgi:hypothetical protein
VPSSSVKCDIADDDDDDNTKEEEHRPGDETPEEVILGVPTGAVPASGIEIVSTPAPWAGKGGGKSSGGRVLVSEDGGISEVVD